MFPCAKCVVMAAIVTSNSYFKMLDLYGSMCDAYIHEWMNESSNLQLHYSVFSVAYPLLRMQTLSLQVTR